MTLKTASKFVMLSSSSRRYLRWSSCLQSLAFRYHMRFASRLSRLDGGKRQRPLFAPCLLMMRCNSPEPQLFVTQLLMSVFRDVQPLNMPGMGMSCYITGPPFEKWHFVGAITNDSPSGVFRVRWPKVDFCYLCSSCLCSSCALAPRTYNTHPCTHV